MIGWTALEPRVFTSESVLPGRDFSGYGFDGPDFIVGTKGLKEFENERQRVFNGTDDGCYLFVEQEREKHRISTDPNGLCKLFVYQSRNGWAISNSFALLIDEVNAKHWLVTPDYAVLDAWTLPPNGFGACFSANSAVGEIKLLNPSQYIEVKAGKLHIEQREQAKASLEAPDYQSRVSEFLGLWLGRIQAIAEAKQLSLRIELTGGLDSRTIFAFLLHLREREIIPSLDDVHVMCAKASSHDYAVAHSLSEIYGFQLNAAKPKPTIQQSARERFAAWRMFSLGMYVPPYMPAAKVEPYTVTLGGHGGERHRLLGRLRPATEILLEYVHKFRRFGRYEAMISTYQQDLQRLNSESPEQPKHKAIRKFWLCFHQRFHHSHMAQYTLRAPPLMSVSLDRCSELLTEPQIEQGFLLFDIMQRLHPGLALHPFDTPEKSASLGRIAKLGPTFDGPITAGKVFVVAEPFDGNGQNEKTETPLAILEQEYERQKHTFLKEGLSPSVLQDADKIIHEISKTQKLPKRILFQPVHAVFLAGLIGAGKIPQRRRSTEVVKLLAKRVKDKGISLVRRG